MIESVGGVCVCVGEGFNRVNFGKFRWGGDIWVVIWILRRS